MAEKPGFTPNPNLIKYARLQIFSNMGNEHLRQAFVKKWNSMDGASKWEDSISNREEFIAEAGKELYRNSSKIQKEYLGYRHIAQWHLPLLIECVHSLNADVSYKTFEDIKAFRNKLINLAKPDAKDQEYENHWNELSALLLKIGLTQEEIDRMKSSPIENLVEESSELEVNPKVTELKNSGNNVFKKNKFKEAIEFYTKALCMPDVPSKELAILYSNRSVAYLNMGDFSSAMENAKSAIHLNQTWWKGYYRLAMACQAKKNYKLTLFYLLMAQQFHESPKNLEPEINYCKQLMSKKGKIVDRYNAAYRKEITIAHRGRFKQLLGMFLGMSGQKYAAMVCPAIVPPLDSGKLINKPKKNLSEYKPIYLEEMDDGCEYIFDGYILKVTLMEDPHEKLTVGTAIHSVVHDERNTYLRLSIYGDYMPERDELLANFGFGSKISIINPYYRVALDGSAVIRVDDFDTVFIHHELKNPKICRYCGDENPVGKIACKDCKRCFYCNTKCMNLDRTEYDHDLICDLSFAFPVPK